MMKIGKKKIFLLIVIVMVVISIMFNLRQKVLGNMSDNIKTKQTSSSDFSFSADEGQIIKVSLRTDVKNGTVDFVLKLFTITTKTWPGLLSLNLSKPYSNIQLRKVKRISLSGKDHN